MIQQKSIRTAFKQTVVLIGNSAPKQDVYQMIYERHGEQEAKIELVNPRSIRFRDRGGLARYIAAQAKHQKVVYVIGNDVNKFSAGDSISLAQEKGEFFAIIPENAQDTKWLNLNHMIMGAPPSCNITELDAMLTDKQLTGATS